MTCTTMRVLNQAVDGKKSKNLMQKDILRVRISPQSFFGKRRTRARFEILLKCGYFELICKSQEHYQFPWSIMLSIL